MTNLVVPYIEYRNLIELVLARYYYQTNVKVAVDSVSADLIQPRQGCQNAVEIKANDPDNPFCLRVYLNYYDFLPDIGEFRPEEFMDSTPGLGNEAQISISILPKSTFPTLAKIFGYGAAPVQFRVLAAVYLSPQGLGYKPDLYDVYKASGVDVFVQTPGIPDDPVTVAHTTEQDTAIAGIDYRTTSGSLHWESGDEAQKKIHIPLLKNRGYVQWYFDYDENTQKTVVNKLQILDNGTRLYVPAGDAAGITEANQQLKGVSQYIEDAARYYEFKAPSIGSSLRIRLSMNYYGLVVDPTNPFYTDQRLETADVQVGYNNSTGRIRYSFLKSDANGRNYETQVGDPENAAGYIHRLHFLFDPKLGVKLGANGKWWDWENNQLVADASQVSYYNYKLVTYDSPKTPRKFYFCLLSDKYTPQLTSSVIDVSMLVDRTQMLYLPTDAIPYQGVSYPDHESSFTSELSNAQGAVIGVNPATINLHDLGQYCYTKINANADHTNLTPGQFNINYRTIFSAVDSYPFKPLIDWSGYGITCGVYCDLLAATNVLPGSVPDNEYTPPDGGDDGDDGGDDGGGGCGFPGFPGGGLGGIN